jgi:hypothetical protein
MRYRNRRPRQSRSFWPRLIEIAATKAQFGEGAILASELARQGVDFGLTFGREGGEMGAIALEERLRICSLVATAAKRPWMKLRDQRSHAALNLPVNQAQLTLDLSARLLRAMKLPFAVWNLELHVVALR